jgi:hypothetical protein
MVAGYMDSISKPCKSFLSTIAKMRLPNLNANIDILFDIDLIQTLQAVQSSFDRPHVPKDSSSYYYRFTDIINPFWDTILASFTSFIDLNNFHYASTTIQGSDLVRIVSVEMGMEFNARG